MRTSRCVAPLSPRARRTALIRVVSADSETMRPPHTPCSKSSLEYDPVAVLHEEGQQVESLGLKVDKLGATAQFAARDVEPVVAKRQNHAPLPTWDPLIYRKATSNCRAGVAKRNPPMLARGWRVTPALPLLFPGAERAA